MSLEVSRLEMISTEMSLVVVLIFIVDYEVNWSKSLEKNINFHFISEF